jgi:polar amino acid transport system substrate-binding protein
MFTRLALVFWLGFALGCGAASPKPPAHAPEPAPVPRITLELVSQRWPPFADAESRPRLALDLVTRALSRAGYDASTEVVPFGALSPALHSDHVDGGAVLSWNAERESFLLYSRPYFENRVVLVARHGTPVDVTHFEQLRGKRIGVVEEYAYGDELEQRHDLDLVRAQSTEENLRALLHDEVDYILVDDLVIHHALAHYPGQLKGRIDVSPTPLIKRTLHLAIRKSRPDAERIINAFNEALIGMLGDGSYNEILQVGWIRADIDNDGRFELISADEHVGPEPPSHVYNLMATTDAGTGAGGTPRMRDVAEQPHFVIKGVPYDSWSAVPNDTKTRTDPTRTDDLGAKPRTLRVEVFDF